MKSGFRKRLTLKSTLLVILLSAILPLFIIGNLLSMNTLRITRTQRLGEMESTTSALHGIFESLLRTSIKTYLRSKVETGRDIARELIDEYGSDSDMTDVKAMLTARLQNIVVGDSGYFYGLNSAGTMVFHPDPNIEGSNLLHETPVKEQLELKEGYLEYKWRNSYETLPKKKALYMCYLPELDWYITATSYREEFTKMVDLDTLEEAFNSLRLGGNGDSFVADSSGRFIIHPRYQDIRDQELLNSNDYKNVLIGLFETGEGFSSYYWSDKAHIFSRKKIVFSKYIEDFDWVVCTTMYSSDINRPVYTIIITNTMLTILTALIMSIVLRRIIRSIEIPISDIYTTLNEATLGDLSVRTNPSGPFEINEVGEYLNIFIKNLEHKTESLQNTIAEKELLIHEIQHRINNNLQIISSMIDLQLNNTENRDSRNILRELYRRVSVIGMVYDHMLLTDTTFEDDTLPLSDFSLDYLSFFFNTDGIDRDKIRIKTDFKAIYLDRSLAISCGLLLNEILSHCCLIMARKEEPSELFLAISNLPDDKLIFKARDNAESFSPDNWKSAGDSLSHTFIRVLVSQLNGEFELVESEDGQWGFQLIFPDKATASNRG